jgi:hypothetical protein
MNGRGCGTQVEETEKTGDDEAFEGEEEEAFAWRIKMGERRRGE